MSYKFPSPKYQFPAKFAWWGQGPWPKAPTYADRVLAQCRLPRDQRTIPAPRENVVWDTVYEELLEAGRLEWVRINPPFASLGDYLITKGNA